MKQKIHKLRKLREELGWSQQELASRSGVGQTIISQIESKGKNAALKTWEKLSKALKVSVGEMLEKNVNPYTEKALPFYAKFQDLENLPKLPQRLILNLMKVLKK